MKRIVTVQDLINEGNYIPMPIPPISLALEGDRGILNIGEFKRKEIDYEQK